MDVYIEQIAKYFENVPLWPLYLLGLIVLFAIAVEIVNHRRRKDAIENFRYTIETELASMYPRHIRWPDNVNSYLCSRLPLMQQNFEVLRVFIPQDQLLEYNTAWNNYCDFCRNITDEKCAASEQENTQESTENKQNLKEEFHNLVSELLKYTKM